MAKGGTDKDGKEKLLPEHERFCVELAADPRANATRAYQFVYPDSSYESARRSASALLTNPDIVARVEELRQERLERTKFDGDFVIRSLVEDAVIDIRAFYNDDGTLKPIRELPREAAACIQSVEVEEIFGKDGKTLVGYTKKLKLTDRFKARELLGRYGKLWKDVGSKENPLETTGDMGDIEKAARIAAILAKAQERKTE